ncbi:MAG: hypothetical protein AMK74_05995 [Nitrospira bacterium SM23_35]|nr:MAG: hypothetical protein AMK74_05995 [Nitrospira bacterium SM23_35]
MIRENFILRKITLIQNELVHLADLAKYSLQEITRDFIKQAALERYLERIINRAIDINHHLISELSTKDTNPPLDYAETFLRLADCGICPEEFARRIARSVGTRNILVHEYDVVDYNSIYSSITDCLKDYHEYCDYILDFLEKSKETL